ncbi:ABC transporter permease [Clostridium sp. AM58-1XD]|uniref:ABC transporter permease n=1 Tax=Clostridium sp. AM58-1XD TaxID=2292307 RepID=UPI000E548FF8|nr:ABC transporter permease [Clostridium sp. AM58-1XD]RGZ01861.1 ABC transporter permease [Clostridium sp. AM58-1XD]
MIAAFTYCRMEFKRACRIFPVFMTGAIVLAALLGTIALLAGKVLYGEAAVGRVQTGVVLPENDAIARQAMTMLSSMDSVESICDFQYLDEETGRSMLESGQLSALLIVPNDFVQSIMNGTNRQVTVVLPENPGIEAKVLREITEAGTRTLKTAQAAIYAADEWLTVSGKQDMIKQTEGDLNRLYLKYALDREIYFKGHMISAAGDLTTAEHFVICGIIMFLILGGIPISGFFGRGRAVFYKKLKIMGIGDGISVAAEVLAVTCMYAAALFILAAAAGTVYPKLWELAGRAGLGGAAGTFFIVMAGAAMVVAVYELCGSRMAGMMAVFWGGIVMMFLSGGIIPSAFLPEALRGAGAWMPASLMIKAMEKTAFSGWDFAEAAKMAAIVLVSSGAAVLGRRSHG